MASEMRVYQEWKEMGPDHSNEKRNYGIDILKIFAMIGIVGLHVLGHGGILQNVQPGIKYILAWGFEVLFSCCVNVYALISGYIGISKKQYSISKLFQLWFEVFFYGVVIWLLMSTFTQYEISGMRLLEAIMPVSSREYWYFTAYVGLFCIMPLLNYVLRHINKTAAVKVVLGIVLLSGYATVVRVFGDPLTLKDGCTYVWISILYIIGGLIRKYKSYLNISAKFMGVAIGVAFLFTLLWKVGFGMFEITIFGRNVGGLFITSVSPPMLIMAICFLLIFADVRISSLSMKVVRFVVPCTFGVYILHDNPLIREYIISDSLISVCEKSTLEFFVIIVCVILIVFATGVLIDKLRILLFRVLRINRISDELAKIFESVSKRTIEFIVRER